MALSQEQINREHSKQNPYCHKGVPGCWCAKACQNIEDCSTCKQDDQYQALKRYHNETKPGD